MTHRIGTKGQIVIPRDVRDQLGLDPGVEVDFEVRDDGVLLQRHQRARTDLGGRFDGSGMASRLIEDRREERR